MVTGRTVRLFLVDGTPTGMLTAEIMNWTGHLLVGPRSRLPEALKRAEAGRTGIYFLTGDDPDEPLRQRVYVGEGDMVSERLKNHAKDPSKDFWTHVCIVTSKDANLTKAHVRYLESRLVELAKVADRASIANGNDPSPKQLPESDIADMEYFLSQLQVALPVVGLDFLRAKPTTSSGLSGKGIEIALVHLQPASLVEETASARVGLELILNNRKHGIEAFALELDEEITVLAGSLAVASDESTSNSYAAKRLSLIKSGAIASTINPKHLAFTTDVTFRSPSEAAAVILNRSSNGRTEWRVRATDQALRDYQDSLLLS